MTKVKATEIGPEAMKKLALTALDDMKAIDVISIDVSSRATFTDHMIFASGSSSRHVISIASSVAQAAKKIELPALGIEGQDIGEWVLVDLGDVIVHVMLPDIRVFYELEKLWSEDLVEPEERNKIV